MSEPLLHIEYTHDFEYYDALSMTYELPQEIVAPKYGLL